jgi:hypothetical protein
MKRCKKCQIQYPLEDFLQVGSRLHARCHNCRKETQREYYRNARQDIKAWIYDYLLDHACIDCGEGDPMRLTFDHRDNKHFDLGKAFIGKAKDLETIQREIAKCDVRCANCHTVKTHIEKNTWKYIMYMERKAHGNTEINS